MRTDQLENLEFSTSDDMMPILSPGTPGRLTPSNSIRSEQRRSLLSPVAADGSPRRHTISTNGSGGDQWPPSKGGVGPLLGIPTNVRCRADVVSVSLSRLPTSSDSPVSLAVYCPHYGSTDNMPVGPGGRTLRKGHTTTGVSWDEEDSRSPPSFALAAFKYPSVGHGGTHTTYNEFTALDFHPENPIAQVSTDILRVSGYSQQFRNLLSSRRRSEPEKTSPEQTPTQPEAEDGQTPPTWKRNGGVQFVAVEEPSEEKDSKSSQVKVIRRRVSRYGIAIASESESKMRCRMRKLLFTKRIHIADLALALAMTGIGFAILDAELTALKHETTIDKYHPVSLFLRCLIVLATIALMVFVFLYHSVEVKIALIDSGAEDWRVAITGDRIVKLVIELVVCCICPVPGTGYFEWPYINQNDPKTVSMVQVPVDVLLSVPMFLRSYLMCRFMVLHSRQFQDAATRSIAALNRISMDFRFVIKTMMSDHPLRVLIVFTCSYWICMSWMFTQCERYDGSEPSQHTYLNALWFVMVTFMSIGYGDIVPNTYCGRTLAIATGIVGAGVSSALIAVMSRKLELSRAEKHVNNFMADSKLTNQRKNAAASVLQQTWLIHKYKTTQRGGKTDDLKVRTHQRRFLQAINEFRRIKWDQRKLAEKGNSLLDIGKMHNEMHETLWEMHRTQDQLISQVDLLTQKIVELQLMLATNERRPSQNQPIANGQAAQEQTPNLSPVNRPKQLTVQGILKYDGQIQNNNSPPTQHTNIAAEV